MNGSDTVNPELNLNIDEKLHQSGVSQSRQKLIRQALENVNKPGFHIDPSAIPPGKI